MASKAEPFSIRLSKRTDELVTREAQRTRRSKSAVVEALAEEALLARRFPGIAFRGADSDRRPWVIGTALDVWEIVRGYREFGSPAEMAAETDLIEAQVRVALAYYDEYADEVDAWIRDADRLLGELRRDFPTIDTIITG